MHAERAIAMQDEHRFVGFRDFRPEAIEQTDTQATGDARVEAVAREEDRNRLLAVGQDLIDDDNGTSRQELADLLAQTQGMNRGFR
jgi:hypothetical protein